jgi:hypothetical protein
LPAPKKPVTTVVGILLSRICTLLMFVGRNARR